MKFLFEDECSTAIKKKKNFIPGSSSTQNRKYGRIGAQIADL
jgi:hypothetical protein